MSSASRSFDADVMANAYGSQASGGSAVQAWMSRYVVNLDHLVQANPDLPVAQLMAQLSPFGREKLSTQVRRHLKVNCELAGLGVHRLFAGTNQVMNLAKVRRLSGGVEAIYESVLTFYARSAMPPEAPASSNVLDLGTIAALSKAIQPALEELRQAHLADEDPRTIGFLTTQFHFATQAICKRLKPWERSLLLPYLQFAEEQVCVPWLDICTAMRNYAPVAPEIRLAEQWIMQMSSIAQATYRLGCQQLPEMRSARGDMKHPQVAASVIRDTTMFQGYLLRCFLEGNLDSIQNHLLPLCVMVFPAVGVSWTWVDGMLRMMVSEIEATVSPMQWSMLAPYAESLLEIFATEDCQNSSQEASKPPTPQPEALEEQRLSPTTSYAAFNVSSGQTALHQPFAPQLWTAFQS